MSAIRYYYKTREDLLLACIDEAERLRVEAATAAIAAAPHARTPREVAALLLDAYYGPDITNENLRGTLHFISDSSRDSPKLSQRLRHFRQLRGSGINDQLATLLEAAGYPRPVAPLAAAVLDGSIFASVAENEPDVAERALRDLTAVLEMAK